MALSLWAILIVGIGFWITALIMMPACILAPRSGTPDWGAYSTAAPTKMTARNARTSSGQQPSRKTAQSRHGERRPARQRIPGQPVPLRDRAAERDPDLPPAVPALR